MSDPPPNALLWPFTCPWWTSPPIDRHATTSNRRPRPRWLRVPAVAYRRHYERQRRGNA